MALMPDRLHLHKILQTCVKSIQAHNQTLCTNTPHICAQVNRLWELTQRHRMLSSSNTPASHILLAECNQIYNQIRKSIADFKTTLADIATSVRSFKSDLNHDENHIMHIEFNTTWLQWLTQVLTVFQTQTKYLELLYMALAPTDIDNETVELFKKELDLPEHYKVTILMGLAQAEQLEHVGHKT